MRAGFLFDTLGGQGQFIVNTDAHEVVAFGGPLPFYAFAPTFNSGDTITLGMTYYLQNNGRHAIIYSANGINSPALEFSNTEFGIIDGSTLGGSGTRGVASWFDGLERREGARREDALRVAPANRGEVLGIQPDELERP